MIPQHLHALFWDVNFDSFTPTSHPDYAIVRVLEFGDESAITWMRKTFSAMQIAQVIRTDRRLSRKSANYWALMYGIPDQEFAALHRDV